jgi:hypothetical protein
VPAVGRLIDVLARFRGFGLVGGVSSVDSARHADVRLDGREAGGVSVRVRSRVGSIRLSLGLVRRWKAVDQIGDPWIPSVLWKSGGRWSKVMPDVALRHATQRQASLIISLGVASGILVAPSVASAPAQPASHTAVPRRWKWAGRSELVGHYTRLGQASCPPSRSLNDTTLILSSIPSH